MTEKIYRSYLEIRSLDELKEVQKPSQNYFVELTDPKDFQLNKFFYKNIGKNCQWVDRLVWTDLNWSDYISDGKLFTYILKDKKEIAGAILDVFKPEPIKANSKLWHTPNLIITPHVSSDDNGNYVKMTLDLFIKNLKLFIEKKELINQIDKTLGY